MATWLEDFYKNNNIGGAGGNLSAGASQYWLNEADKHGADKVKSIIEGTAKAEGTWNQAANTNTNTSTNTNTPSTGGTTQSTSGGTTGGTSGQITTGAAGSTATGGTGTGNTQGTINNAWYSQLSDPGLAVSQGLNNLTGLANKYEGTDIATAVVGQLGDLYTSQAKQGMMLTFDDLVQSQNLKHTIIF